MGNVILKIVMSVLFHAIRTEKDRGLIKQAKKNKKQNPGREVVVCIR